MINSTTSGNAPTDFKLYDSTESTNEIINKSNDICNLCSSDKYPAYCIRCLINGEFTYSRESQYNISRNYSEHCLHNNTKFINTYDKFETLLLSRIYIL